MRVVIAVDSFKGSLTSLEAGRAVQAGLLRAMPDAVAEVCPLADGGEGTVAALTAGLGGVPVDVEVTGPLGTPVVCRYGMADDLAIIEMAGAAGLPLVPPAQRDPLCTTTYGWTRRRPWARRPWVWRVWRNGMASRFWRLRAASRRMQRPATRPGSTRFFRRCAA